MYPFLGRIWCSSKPSAYHLLESDIDFDSRACSLLVLCLLLSCPALRCLGKACPTKPILIPQSCPTLLITTEPACPKNTISELHSMASTWPLQPALSCLPFSGFLCATTLTLRTQQYQQYDCISKRLAAAFPPRFIIMSIMWLVLCAVCPFMIYGEVVQKWRLAKGATLRKWPHAAGIAPSHISRSIAQLSTAEVYRTKECEGGLCPLYLVCGLLALCIQLSACMS